jgi:hypothetical protein
MARVLAAVGMALVWAGVVRADDPFDHYLNRTLSRLAASKDAREVKSLTLDQLLDHDRVLKGVPGTFLVVQSNEGRWAKLLVREGRLKVREGRPLPILLVERHVTYKEGEERTVLTSGKNLALFDSFRLSLDLGQIVPEAAGGDVVFEAGKGDGEGVVRPLGRARLFVVTRAPKGVGPAKGPKLVVGPTFEPRYFNGKFKLYDDGRRSGTLELKVGKGGSVTGSYYSDKDGSKYEVTGRLTTPRHAIRFVIKLPRARQEFEGMLFTGNARALAGKSRLLDHEAAFYAVRVEE